MQYYLTVFPSSSSLSFIENLVQIAISGRYQDFDYGVQRNMQEYGTPQPPEFQINGFTGIPIAFIYGTLDNVISPTDVQWVISQVGDNLVSNQTYPYGHLTYFVGSEMEYLQDVVELLDEYNDPQIASSD